MKGTTPEPLKNKPIIPWYYMEFIHHFQRLSTSRTYRADPTPSPSGGVGFIYRPNPIDIISILKYNAVMAKAYSPEDFLDIIQALDSQFLAKTMKKQHAN